MKGDEGSVEDMLNIKGLPSAKMQDLRNLAGMGGDNRCVRGSVVAVAVAVVVVLAGVSLLLLYLY